jgi:catechol 2,3-dioxygenase-like lactoylglutathione lyase family enzyme
LVNNSYVSAVRQLSVNVSDFERSREFYKMLGFTRGERLPGTESLEVAKAMGLEQPYEINAELIKHATDDSNIELTEWKSPRDLTPPHPHPVNHLGMQRINYATTDLEGDIAKLKAQGVKFLSPIAPCCSGDSSTFGFILFFDPDGNFFQLMGAIEPKK